MQLEVTGELIYWRGPAPFHFVTVTDPQAAHIESVSGAVSYGWGMIPVAARIGATTWTTALWPREGLYVIPVKDAIRRAEKLELGMTTTVGLTIEV